MQHLRAVASTIMENVPVSVRKPPVVSEEVIWSDASDTGGAYILQGRAIVENWKWSERQAAEAIHVREAWALERGVRRWVADSSVTERVLLKTDSMLVFFALQKKNATGWVFAQSIRSSLAMLKGRNWEVEWVPSGEQLADKPSRV